MRVLKSRFEKAAPNPRKGPSASAPGLPAGQAGTGGNKEEKIRKKAYELYEQRGCQDGHDQEDWFEAEKMHGVDY